MKKFRTIKKRELLTMMDEFDMIFDVVRIVDPHNTDILSFENGSIQKAEQEACFSVWEREGRCDNCISLRACVEKKRMSKFETRNDEVYSVVSMPFFVEDIGQGMMLALELVNRISEDMVFYASGTGGMSEELNKIKRKVYQDSLTGLYNRRYYDENLYLFELRHSRKMGILAIDVDRFKYVNDVFGHNRGDELLVSIADVLMQNVRREDRIMRVGGDEFLIALSSCSKSCVEKRMEQIKRGVSEISLKWMENYRPSISVGLAYSDQFDGSSRHFSQLFQAADSQMYANKEKTSRNRDKILLVVEDEKDGDYLKCCLQPENGRYEEVNSEEILEILKKDSVEVLVRKVTNL